jgi:hypothetical protein
MSIKHSMWGPVQQEHPVADGITFVSTAGHGGYVLSDERAAQLREKFPRFESRFSTATEFEEDCDANVVILAFPECFSDERVYFAVQMVSSRVQGNEDESSPWVHVALELIKQIDSESPIARASRWKSENANNYRITGSSTNGVRSCTYLRRISDGMKCEIPVMLHGNIVQASVVESILLESVKTQQKTIEATDSGSDVLCL